MSRFALVFYALVLSSAASVAHAQFSNPLSSPAIVGMVESLVRGVIYVGTPGVIALLVWTGFLFVSAQGNPEGLSKARGMFLKVVLGGLLLFSLWAIAVLVGSTVGALSTLGLLLVFAVGFFYLRSR